MDFPWYIIIFFVGYLVGKTTSSLFTTGAAIRTMTIAQIQAIRLLRDCMTHYGRMRYWHEAYAATIDEAQDILKKTINNPDGIEVELLSGEKTRIRINAEDADGIATLWANPRKEELKGVWNLNNYALIEYKQSSAALIKSGMQPYEHMVQWDTFSDAMNWLAVHELEINKAKKTLEEQNNGK
jgi:hypothetical protein